MTLQQTKTSHRGVEQLVARQAHNLEVACSSPASATIKADIFMSAFFILHGYGCSIRDNDGLPYKYRDS